MSEFIANFYKSYKRTYQQPVIGTEGTALHKIFVACQNVSWCSSLKEMIVMHVMRIMM